MSSRTGEAKVETGPDFAETNDDPQGENYKRDCNTGHDKIKKGNYQ